MPGPQTFVPTFDIYSVGDALYLQRVINGVAMMSNSKIFMILGMVGLLLGLLVISIRAVTSGLQRLEVSQLVVSIILFFAMFGLKANVTINDMVGSPFGAEGIATPPTVNNVPYGVAVSAWLITSAGYHLAEYFEQGYGTTGSTFGGVTSGGFGKSLAWLNAIRNMEIPEIDNSDGTVQNFKKNMSSYLSNCARIEANYKRINLDAARVSRNILSDGSTSTDLASAGGIGVQNKALTTEWVDSTGTTVTPCTSALLRLRSVAGSSLYGSVANALSGKSMKWNGSPEGQLTDAFQQIAMDTEHAQAYVTNMAVMSVWNEALSRDGMANSITAAAMMTQAREQRATQWAGEESMFKSVARGFTAFFEGMIFACAPFMALAIGLGSLGWSMVMRYMILSAWVALWLPVLSVINLFQTTVIEHAVNAMLVNGQLNGTSAASTAYLAGRITEWVGTGAALAASTPAITLMLLMGGAVTATALMGRMQGGDFINEKTTSPDVANAAPAMNQSSALNFDPSTGLRQSGSDNTIPTLRGDAASSVTVSSALSKANQATDNYLKEASHQLQSGMSVNDNFSVGASHQVSSQAQQAFSEFGSYAKGQGFNVSSEGAMQVAKLAMLSATAGGGASIGASGGGSSVNTQVGVNGTSSNQINSQDAQKLLDALRSDTSKGHDLRFALAKAVNDSGVITSGKSSTGTQSSTGSDRLAKTWSAAKSAEQRYQEASQQSNQFSIGQSANVNQVARSLIDKGKGSEAITAAISSGGNTGFQTRLGDLRSSSWGKHFGEEEAQVGAALLQLQSESMSGNTQAADSFTKALADSGMFVASDSQSAAAAGNAMGLRGMESPDPSGTGVVTAVDAAHLGSGISSSGVYGAAHDLQSGADGVLGGAAAATGAKLPNQGDIDRLGNVHPESPVLRSYINDFFRADELNQEHAAAVSREQGAMAKDHTDAGGFSSKVGRVMDDLVGENQTRNMVGMYLASEGKPMPHVNPFTLLPDQDTSYLERAKELEGNADLRDSAKQYFQHQVSSGAPIAEHGLSGVASADVSNAMAAISTAHHFGGYTPEMKKELDSSLSRMSEHQRHAVMDVMGNGEYTERAGSRMAIEGNWHPQGR